MLFSQPTIDEGWDPVKRFIANLTASCRILRQPPRWLLPVSTLHATIEKSAVLYADNPDIGFCVS